MATRSKRAQTIKKAKDFDVGRVKAALAVPKGRDGTIREWSLARIACARDAQMDGRFHDAVRMAEQMRSDDALAVAEWNRLAPQYCIPTEIKPSNDTTRAKAVGLEAASLFGDEGIAFSSETKADIHQCLVTHGLAFATLAWTPREDGTRVDCVGSYFPLEHVRYDRNLKIYVATVDPETIQPGDRPEGMMIGANEVPIAHGDGRWIIFKKHEVDSHRKEAAILPASLVWARHAFAVRDWAKGSVAHGNAKVVGELPIGVELQTLDADGNPVLSSEAAAFLALLQDIASADSPAGIRPAGAKTDFLTNNSTAWQVWSELVANAEKAAARIYLGTDGTLGTQGGAPGVDITALFGVAVTRIRGDLGCIQRAITSGALVPWTAINFGDSTLCPSLRYCIPDEERETERENYNTRYTAFQAAIKAARANGYVVDQAFSDALAEAYGVASPVIATESTVVTLAQVDLPQVITVNEARATCNLGVLLGADGAPDPDGRLTVACYTAKHSTPSNGASAPLQQPADVTGDPAVSASAV